MHTIAEDVGGCNDEISSDDKEVFSRAELPTDDPQWEEMKRQKKRKERREEDLEALHSSMFG